MRIAILGTGALARFYAAVLNEARPKVIGNHPLGPFHFWEEQGARLIRPDSQTWDRALPAPDLVLIAVKWPAMPTVGRWLHQHAARALAISLLNGMGQEQSLKDSISPERLAVGTTTTAVTRVDGPEPGVVVRSRGYTWLPLLSHPDWPTIQHWAMTRNLNWQWCSPQEVYYRRWIKLVQNSIINPLSVLADRPNGHLPDMPIWMLARALTDEALAIARALGIPISEDILDETEVLARQTAGNISSMLQDVRRRRTTEIDAITGYLLRQAEATGVSAPTHYALYTLIRRLGG